MATKATIHERGNGLPDVGAYVPGDDGEIYYVKSTSPGCADWMNAELEPANRSDVKEEDVFPARAVLEFVPPLIPFTQRKTTMRRSTKLDADWRQVAGDINPGIYGCVLACRLDDRIEVYEVFALLDALGEREALDAGAPFWSSHIVFRDDELQPSEPNVIAAAECCDLDLTSEETTDLDIALAVFRYGGGDVQESPKGFARDVFPKRAFYWHNEKMPTHRALSGAAFAAEDREFRRLQREAKRR